MTYEAFKIPPNIYTYAPSRQMMLNRLEILGYDVFQPKAVNGIDNPFLVSNFTSTAIVALSQVPTDMRMQQVTANEFMKIAGWDYDDPEPVYHDLTLLIIELRSALDAI